MTVKKPNEDIVTISGSEVVTVTAQSLTKAEEYIPKTWEEALQHFADADGGIVTFESGDYTVIDKDELVGVPFVIIEAKAQIDKTGGREYWSLLCMTKGDKRVCVNDGSTGIKAQVDRWFAETGRNAGIICPRGLRRSDYQVEVPTVDKRTGEITMAMTDATTFYIA